MFGLFYLSVIVTKNIKAFFLLVLTLSLSQPGKYCVKANHDTVVYNSMAFQPCELATFDAMGLNVAPSFYAGYDNAAAIGCECDISGFNCDDHCAFVGTSGSGYRLGSAMFDYWTAQTSKSYVYTQYVSPTGRLGGSRWNYSRQKWYSGNGNSFANPHAGFDPSIGSFDATLITNVCIYACNWKGLCNGGSFITSACASNPCVNGGTCSDSGADFSCDCSGTGYDGIQCELDYDDCASSPCENGGICNDPGLLDAFTCDCSGVDFDGVTCNTWIDDCIATPCANGGTCVDLTRSFSCNCSLGFNGNVCQTDIDECLTYPCDSIAPAVCLESVPGSFTCNCVEGVTGLLCETNIDDCASSPCLNGGVCSDLLAAFSCDCSATGSLEETCNVTACSPDDPCPWPSLCTSLPNLDFRCDLFDCVSSPCLENEICLPMQGGGYTCEEDGCEPNPCHFTEVCVAKPLGTNMCDNGGCDSSPCSVNEVCIGDVNNGYNCVPDECASDPCLQNRVCEMTDIGMYVCHSGSSSSSSSGPYGGTISLTSSSSSLQTDPCDSSPCFNGGTCQSEGGGNDYQCTCVNWFDGVNCEISCREPGACGPEIYVTIIIDGIPTKAADDQVIIDTIVSMCGVIFPESDGTEFICGVTTDTIDLTFANPGTQGGIVLELNADTIVPTMTNVIKEVETLCGVTLTDLSVTTETTEDGSTSISGPAIISVGCVYVEECELDDSCDPPEACTSSPCQNGGECIGEGIGSFGYYVYMCGFNINGPHTITETWVSVSSDEVEEYSQDFIATYLTQRADYECDCTGTGFTGDFCEISEEDDPTVFICEGMPYPLPGQPPDMNCTDSEFELYVVGYLNYIADESGDVELGSSSLYDVQIDCPVTNVLPEFNCTFTYVPAEGDDPEVFITVLSDSPLLPEVEITTTRINTVPNPEDSTEDQNNNDGMGDAGVIIGGSFGAVLVLALVAFFVMRDRKKKQNAYFFSSDGSSHRNMTVPA